MKISKKEDYAVQIMCALAQTPNISPLSLDHIAKDHKLPLAFVRQIASLFIKAKLIKSKEGSGGGYFLAHDASSITLKEILEAVSGPTRLTDCTSPNTCALESQCLTRKPWIKIHKIISDVFENITLDKLIQY